jgi:ribonuclease PH
VLLEGGKIAEVQATAEGATYDEEGLLRLLRLARIGCDRIFAAQEKDAVKAVTAASAPESWSSPRTTRAS